MNKYPKDTALRDRIHVIEVPDYTIEDQIQIVKKYLFPKALNNINTDSNSIIISDIDNLGDEYYSSIICSNKAVVNLGECQAGTLLEHRFELFNPDKEDLILNTISVSCSCGKAIIPEPIKSNEFGYLICTIDTSNKMLNKEYDLWFTIRYNEIKRMNFKLIYNTK